MGRRSGRDGLTAGEVGAVGTIGLLGTPSPTLPVPRLSLGVSNGYHEDACRLITVENGIRKLGEESPADIEIDWSAIWRLDDEPKSHVEFFNKTRRHSRIAFRIPCRGVLAFNEGARV